MHSPVGWLQEHLPFPDEYLAQLISVSPELSHNGTKARARAFPW